MTYYDTYGFCSLTGFTNTAYFPAATVSANGYLTGSVSVILENGTKLYSANYYDKKGRVTKSVSSNHMGGYETTNTTYTFTDMPLTVQHIHTASGQAKQTEMYTYTYDHAERVTKTQYTLNGSTVTLAMNTYNNLGQLFTKSLHGSSTNKLTYTYNLRDWLTEIESTNFTQNLYYNTGSGTACYNGNISSMTWKNGAESAIRGYKFTYDNLSRIKNAVYGEGATISANGGRFSENITNYDRNGNIKSLQRYGKSSSTAYGMIDNLTVAYTGNQLKYANDAATDPIYSGAFNFVNGSNSTGAEYIFDNNGNLQQDYNKKTTKIQYNQLNLPSALQFTNGNRTDYLYSADGAKRCVTHQTAIANISVPMGQMKDLTNIQVSQTHTIDYCGNVIYENKVLNKILTEEGYVTLSGTTPTYHYYLKDHQGNNRVVLHQNGTTVEQVNHYYPFGGLFGEGTATSNQAYKYNGKELDRMYGLDWYDYGARHYDAALGRFTTIDPSSESYYTSSPYAYCGSNPINRIDPTGADWYEDEKGNLHWIEGSLDVDGYHRLGSSVSIRLGENSYFNAYQNAGILANQAVNAFDLISSSDKLQNQFLGKDSPLSEASKSALFNSLNSHSMDAIARPIGEAIFNLGAGELGGALAGKAIGWAVGKFAGRTNSVLRPFGIGNTGRTIAQNLTEQMTMQEALSNPLAGDLIERMAPINDTRWLGWRKMQYIHTGLDGSKTVIHYVGKWENGILKAVDDFKFK